MTRLSISIAASILTITLAPAAAAYATDPDDGMLREVSELRLLAEVDAVPTDICTVKVSSEMAQLLGLPENWRIEDGDTVSAMACNTSN